jgi:apolipoprotein N-acyltransferase
MLLEGARPGDVFECPSCAREFSPPDHVAPATATKPATPAPECEILVLRPSMLRGNPLAFLGLWACVALGLAGAAWVGLLRDRASPAWIVLAAGAALALAALLAWKLRTLSSEIRVTSKRLIDRDGLFRQRTSEVLHRDVRNIRVEQTLWERIRGIGTLAIYTASDDEPEVSMTGVPHPHRVRKVIDMYRPM